MSDRVFAARRTHLALDSSSLSIVFCRCSSFMRVRVNSFSLSLDSLVEMGGVTPRYLKLRQIVGQFRS